MKTNVQVTTKQDAIGNTTPTMIHWPDGCELSIDRVLDVCQESATAAGRQGMRYICRVGNKEVYLLQDELDGKWYIE